MQDTSTFRFKTNFNKKIGATLIDYSIYGLLFFIYVGYYGHPNNEGGKTVEGFAALPIFVFWFLYFVVCEFFFGGTLGHKSFGLIVVSLRGNNVTFVQTLKRRFMDVFDLFWFGIPAYIAIKNTDKHQRLGDLWAQTVVVDTMDPEQPQLRFQPNAI